MLCAAATKRGKWSVPDQQQAHADELAAAANSAHSAAELSKCSLGKSLASKRSIWSPLAGQGRAQPASASADTFQLSEGTFSQPCVQPTSLLSDTHLGEQSDFQGSSKLGSSCVDANVMAEEIRKQQQQSFKHLLEQQNL